MITTCILKQHCRVWFAPPTRGHSPSDPRSSLLNLSPPAAAHLPSCRSCAAVFLCPCSSLWSPQPRVVEGWIGVPRSPWGRSPCLMGKRRPLAESQKMLRSVLSAAKGCEAWPTAGCLQPPPWLADAKGLGACAPRASRVRQFVPQVSSEVLTVGSKPKRAQHPAPLRDGLTAKV